MGCGYIVSLEEIASRCEPNAEALHVAASEDGRHFATRNGKQTQASKKVESRPSTPMCLTGARLERLSGGGFRGDGMCGDFQKGKCSRGEGCRYAHVKTRVEGSAPLLVDHLVLRVAAQVVEGRRRIE